MAIFDMRQHTLISDFAYVLIVPFTNVPNDIELMNDFKILYLIVHLPCHLLSFSCLIIV